MANGTWNRVVARALVLGLLCGVMGLVAPAAMAAPAADLNAEQRSLIWKLSDRKLLREALEITRELERYGRLAPGDRRLLELIPKIIESMPDRRAATP